MSRKSRRRKIAFLVYAFLVSVILWQSFSLIKYTRSSGKIKGLKTFQVTVDGNVRRPGLYSVPEGTTQFEILKMAGVRPTSNLSSFNLSSQISENARLEVGTLDKPAGATLAARLEFYFGELNVISSDGRNRPVNDRMEITSGDRVLTEASTQAEISFGAFSRVDIDNYSELVFDKIGSLEDEKKVTELYQKSGLCWYTTMYTDSKNEVFRVFTHSAVVTVGGRNADYLIEVQNDIVQINLSDGLLLVERAGGGEAMNMISGQSVTIYKDGRPFQVSRLTAEVSSNERFSRLSSEKVKHMKRLVPMNFLFCGVPPVFFLVSLQYESGNIFVVRIPPALLIEQFTQNISTLSEAFLFGGPSFVSTFVERIFDIRISNYAVLDKGDVLRIADILGGIPAVLDPKTAASLNVSSGQSRLSGTSLGLYLAGDADNGKRQTEVLKSIINEFRTRKAVLTAILADQILNGTETNITASEVMDLYTRFIERKGWEFRDRVMPIRMVERRSKVCYDPVLNDCKILLNSNE